MPFPAALRSTFIEFLKKEKIAYTNGWENYMENVDNPAALSITVDTDEQVQTVLRAIHELNRSRTPHDKITVRAAAGWSNTSGGYDCLFPFWRSTQEKQYGESYSFSEVVGGRASPDSAGTDVVIRFSKKHHHISVMGPVANPNKINPNNPIHKLPCHLVEVDAGVQIAELIDYLRKCDLSLSTVSMIAWVTAVGLAGTGGHGTGRDETGFSGLIESLVVCDMYGNIREVKRGDADFDQWCGAHSGLLGVVLKMRIRAVKGFNLAETIELFDSAKAMTADKLSNILLNNQYVSIMGMPFHEQIQLEKKVPKWQVREWNYTEEKPTQHQNASYHPDVTSFTQEVEVRIGSAIMEYLLDPGLKDLFPLYMAMAGSIVAESRGTKRIVDFENKITHPQVAFPKGNIRDVSYQIPVKDKDAGRVLSTILQKMEDIIDQMGAKGKYPLTYALYVRYIKGTNGGLSTTYTASDDEHIIALDMVTDSKAPGVKEFEQAFIQFLKEEKLEFRCHLGKNFPEGVENYQQFLGEAVVAKYIEAMERWHATPGKKDGAEHLAMSPFLTPYLQKMLNMKLALTNENVKASGLEADTKSKDKERIAEIDVRKNQHSPEDRVRFLESIIAAVSPVMVTGDAGRASKQAFLEACHAQCKAQRMMQLA